MALAVPTEAHSGGHLQLPPKRCATWQASHAGDWVTPRLSGWPPLIVGSLASPTAAHLPPSGLLAAAAVEPRASSPEASGSWALVALALGGGLALETLRRRMMCACCASDGRRMRRDRVDSEEAAAADERDASDDEEDLGERRPVSKKQKKERRAQARAARHERTRDRM